MAIGNDLGYLVKSIIYLYQTESSSKKSQILINQTCKVIRFYVTWVTQVANVAWTDKLRI